MILNYNDLKFYSLFTNKNVDSFLLNSPSLPSNIIEKKCLFNCVHVQHIGGVW